MFIRLRPIRAFLRNIGVFACAFSILLLCPGPRASAALLPSSLLVKVVSVKGSATNTITSLVFLNDVTLQIEAEQVGYLTHFGNFTGHFSYLAVASPASILLVGNATLTNDLGEKLFLSATVLELGADYPRSVIGTLTVTGGTGRYAGATGSLSVNGVDEESLTDIVTINGALIISAVH